MQRQTQISIKGRIQALSPANTHHHHSTSNTHLSNNNYNNRILLTASLTLRTSPRMQDNQCFQHHTQVLCTKAQQTHLLASTTNLEWEDTVLYPSIHT
jgi:hypothetical protein